MIQTRTNVPLGFTGQQPLLQARLRLRITVQHVYTHEQDMVNEILGFISNQNINTRCVRPSFDSSTLLDACGKMDEQLHVSRDVRRTHTPVPRVQSRSL